MNKKEKIKAYVNLHLSILLFSFTSVFTKMASNAFNENGIFDVEINDPFKGGMITQTIFSKTNCDVIQIEINGNYRNIEEPEKIKLICDSIIKFINQYTNIINK